MMRELCCTTPGTMHEILLVFEALVCATHGFSGMGNFLFWYGEEEWWNEVAKRREKGY